jgi:hypothetical protein
MGLRRLAVAGAITGLLAIPGSAMAADPPDPAGACIHLNLLLIELNLGLLLGPGVCQAQIVTPAPGVALPHVALPPAAGQVHARRGVFPVGVTGPAAASSRRSTSGRSGPSGSPPAPSSRSPLPATGTPVPLPARSQPQPPSQAPPAQPAPAQAAGQAGSRQASAARTSTPAREPSPDQSPGTTPLPASTPQPSRTPQGASSQPPEATLNPAPALEPGPVATPGTGGYSATVPFDRALRIPLQTPRMTLTQSGVVATIALVTATLGAVGLGPGSGTDTDTGTGTGTDTDGATDTQDDSLSAPGPILERARNHPCFRLGFPARRPARRRTGPEGHRQRYRRVGDLRAHDRRPDRAARHR